MVVLLAACAGVSPPQAPPPIAAPTLDDVSPAVLVERDWAVLPEPGPVV